MGTPQHENRGQGPDHGRNVERRSGSLPGQCREHEEMVSVDQRDRGSQGRFNDLIGYLRNLLIIQTAEYPENILDELTAKGVHIEAMDALTLAEEAGSSKAVNIVLMGQLAKHFHIDYDKWISAIEQTVKPKFIELNKKAFELGYNFGG